MSSLIDFTNCKRVYGKAYNGANGKKIAVIYDGNRYMIKFPPSGNTNQLTFLTQTVASVSILPAIFSICWVYRLRKLYLEHFKLAKRQKRNFIESI